MKKRYVTFIDQEREIISDLPWGDDSLVVVLATDTKRLERARFEFNERVGRLLRSPAEYREEQEKTLRDLNGMVMGMRPTTIAPKYLAMPKIAPASAQRSPPKRHVPKRPS